MTRTEITLQLASGIRLPVSALHGSEAINQPCVLSVDCLNPQTPDDIDELPGQAVSLVLQAGEQTRYWHLTIDAIQRQSRGNSLAWQFTLANKLHWGRQLQQTRLFMDRNREQVLRQLLNESGYADHEIDLKLDPVPAPAGPYLQAQESHLDCFQRLLAEVGGNYWFEYHADKEYEILVIRNDTTISPYLEQVQWAQAVSGLAPDQQLNRITAAKVLIRNINTRHGQAVQQHSGASSRDDANVQHFAPPLPRRQAEQRALLQQQADDCLHWQLQLDSHQPMLTAGYTLVLDAGQLPLAESGEFRLLSIEHSAKTVGEGQGLRYHNTAVAIRRSTPVRGHIPAPKHLPMMFPARIESRYPYAELDANGRYRLRPGFDGSNRPVSSASPLIERLSGYAGPADHDALPPAGWHFPLLDQSTVMVSCLNNDPARMAILGFLPCRRQPGPVTHDNAEQSRIVTPAQNELIFDDSAHAERIALFTFDGQNMLELSAQGAEHLVRLLSQYGSQALRAGAMLHVQAGENFSERTGGSHRVTVKQASRTEVEGSIRYQAETDLSLTAQQQLNMSAGGDFSLWVQQGSLTTRIGKAASTVISGGDMKLKVSNGAMITQVNGDITITGNGGGDILLTDGTGGFKIDAHGNVKLFGKKVTLKGTRNGVTLNGNISYETGGANEVEDVEALEMGEMEEIKRLVPENAPRIDDINWSERTVLLGQQTELNIAFRNLTEGSEMTLTIEQVNPDGSSQEVVTSSEPVAHRHGVSTVIWTTPSHTAEPEQQDAVDGQKPYYYRAKASCDGVESEWSGLIQVNNHLLVDLEEATGQTFEDGTRVQMTAADQLRHEGEVQQGNVRFRNVASGAITMHYKRHNKETRS